VYIEERRLVSLRAQKSPKVTEKGPSYERIKHEPDILDELSS